MKKHHLKWQENEAKMKAKSTTEIAQMVTGLVTEALTQGHIPWNKPWASAEIGGLPTNYTHNTQYNGSNVIVLTSVMMCNGYKHNKWTTFKGAKTLGGNVKKGEKGYPVTFWKFIEKDVEGKNGELKTKKIPFLRYFNVFNIEQCEGIEMPKTPKKRGVLKTIKEAEAIIKAYDLREESLTIKIQDSDRAYYNMGADLVVNPTMRQHTDKAQSLGQTINDGKQHFYSSLFHELTHSTMLKSRCDRERDLVERLFDSDKHEYSKEELVAEIGSAILGAKAGLTSQAVIENTKAYCQGWAKRLNSEPKWIIWAGSRAEKASKYILGETEGK